MPSSRADRARRHQSQTTNESNTSSMSNGQESVQMIRGRGLRKVIRHSGKDYYQLLDDTGASQSEAASISLGSGNLTVTTTTSSGTGEGVTVHGDLTGKANDDHTQYVHNDTARTITANHTFSGRPIFNGGTNSLSPFTVNEDTLVANLNADKWDGYEFSDYLNQAVLTTSAPTFATVNTGQGANELYAMNQNVRSTDAVTFATVDTGQGANELYDMNQNVLTSSDVTFADLTTSGDILVQGDDISSDPFTSGFTGSGWKIDNTGTAEFSNASIRGTLSVYELLLQQLRATNGSVLITAVAKIESIDGNDLTFEDPSDNGVCPFHTNDIVMVQRANITGSASGDSGGGTLNVIKRLVRRVTSVSGRTITVTRDGDLPSDTDSFAVGDDVVRIGNTTNTNRDAILYLSADDSKAPYLIIKDGVNSWANWGSASTEKARLGRLDGITDTDVGLDGNQANLYGLYSDAVYLKGHINATSGTIGGVNITNGSLSISSSNISDVNAYTTNQDRQTFDGLLDDSPSGTGFFMDANKLGYYTSSAWKTYMGKNGDFALAGTGGSGEGSLTWDSSTSTLTIAGSITVKNPNDFAPTDATANQSDATTNNAIAAKSKVFYQDGAPSSGHSTNDIWYDTNDGYKRYVYNGSSWVNSADTTYDQSSLITNAQNTANARNTTFFQSSAPTANAIGDLWVDTDDNYKLWRASAANNSSWQAATPDPDVNTTTIIGNTVTTGFVNALNVNANTVSAGWVYAGNLTAEQIQTAGGSFAATKNYDMRGSTNSWIVDYASITAYTGYTTVQGASSQNGTRLRSPTFSGVHGERDRYIKIRIRRQAGTGWYGRLYWIGNAGSYSDSRYALVPNPSSTAEDSWTTLLIDMWDLNVGGTAWKTDTAITNLRLDMGTTASDNFDIQYIGIGDVTDTPGTFIDGDGIYTGTINADNINAGTMTGRTVQTTGGGTKLDDTGDFGDLSPSENLIDTVIGNTSTAVDSNGSHYIDPNSTSSSNWSSGGTLCVRFDLKCTNVQSGHVDYGSAKLEAKVSINGSWSTLGQPQYIDFISPDNVYQTHEMNFSAQQLDDAEVDSLKVRITELEAPGWAGGGYGGGSGTAQSTLYVKNYKYIRIDQKTEINKSGIRSYATSKNYAKFGSGGNYFKGGASISGNLNVYGEAYKLVAGSWLTTSDKRLKNVSSKFTKGLSTIKDIDIVNYEYKHDLGKKHVGIIAQDLEKVLPEAVSEKVAMGYDDLKVVSESPVLWTLVNAVKELSDEMDKMKKGCKCGRK